MKKLNDEEVKDTLFDILVYFDRLCQENNLIYTLDAGTLLGAARHKDFIPWDDDIDVAMPYSDYKKFIKLGSKIEQMDNKFKLCGYSDEKSKEENYVYPFLKLEDISTKAVIKKARDTGGAWIDIFPLVNIPDEKKELKQYAKKLDIYHWLIGKGDLPNSSNIIKNIAKSIVRRGEHYYRRRMIEINDEISHTDSHYIADILWADDRINHIFPKSLFDTYIELEFRGKKFRAIKDYDKYLSILYGEWRKLPPVEDRVGHHDYDLYIY